MPALKPRRKTSKKGYSPEYGARADWAMRVNNSMVRHGDVLVFCDSIKQEKSEKVKKLYLEYQHLEMVYVDSRTDENALRYQKARDAYSKAKETDTEGEITVRCTPYINKKKGTLPTPGSEYRVNVKELDLSLTHTGFVNIAGKLGKRYSRVAYVSRMPYRQTKQGLSRESAKVTTLDGNPDELRYKEVAQAIYGNYPTLTETLDQLFSLDGTNSMAFHPEFSIVVDETGHTKLYNRTTCVGYCQDAEAEEPVFKLFGRYEYLREILTTANVEIY